MDYYLVQNKQEFCFSFAKKKITIGIFIIPLETSKFGQIKI